MSALITLAVNPKNGDKPYILIGSDSKKVDAYMTEEGWDVLSIDENSQKTYEINKNLIGIAGAMDEEFGELLLKFISDNNLKINDLSEKVTAYIEDYMKKSIVDIFRCVVTIANFHNGNPIIARIAVDKNRDTEVGYLVATKGEIKAAYTGRNKEYNYQEAFMRDAHNSLNFAQKTIRKAAIKYLKAVSARYPDKCNQNIVIRILEQ